MDASLARWYKWRMLRFRHTRGATLTLTLKLDSSGLDLTPIEDWAFSSRLCRFEGTPVDTLSVSYNEVDQEVVISATPDEQIDWPLGELFADLQLRNSSGEVYYSEPVALDVRREYTPYAVPLGIGSAAVGSTLIVA